jgi:hypothetical protein
MKHATSKRCSKVLEGDARSSETLANLGVLYLSTALIRGDHDEGAIETPSCAEGVQGRADHVVRVGDLRVVRGTAARVALGRAVRRVRVEHVHPREPWCIIPSPPIIDQL